LEHVDRLNAAMACAPLHQWLGCHVTAYDEATGEVRVALPYRPELRRSEEDNSLHGGVVAALADLAAHAALNAVTGIGMPTIDLRVDYLRPALPPLEAVATPRRIGRSIGVVDIEVLDGAGKLAALGRVVYRTASG